MGSEHRRRNITHENGSQIMKFEYYKQNYTLYEWMDYSKPSQLKQKKTIFDILNSSFTLKDLPKNIF